MLRTPLSACRHSVILALLCVALSLDAREPPPAKAYALDDLYALPRLEGTPPGGATWSADGTQLAFLWNAEGYAFRDIWLLADGGSTPRRLTYRSANAPPDSRDTGITEVAWMQPAAKGLMFVEGGALFSVDGDGSVRPLAPAHEYVRELTVSPGGERFTFVDGGPLGSYQFEFHPGGGLWIGDPGTIDAPPRLLVTPEGEARFVESYQWSADGGAIAFVMADRSPVPRREIHYTSGGEAKLRTVHRAFPGEATTRRRIGVVDLATGEIEWVEREDAERPIWDYGLSGDGRKLFVSESDFLIKEHVIDLHDLASGERTRFYTHRDAANTTPGWQVAWAPKDEGLLILTDRDGWYHVYHQRVAGGTPRQVTRGEWEISGFAVDRRADALYVLANASHAVERQIYRIALSGGEAQRLSVRPGTHRPVYAPDFARAAVVFSSDNQPHDLYMNALDGKQASRITHSPRKAFSSYQLAQVRYLSFPSHVDGTRLLGRLLVPPDFDSSQRYPLVVGSVYPNTVRNRWGGGSALPVWGLDQHLVSRGYLVFAVDVRGSRGHGSQFTRDLHGDYGGIDKDDLASGVKHLLKEGYVDPSRVGIWGWSYGGLMTLMSLSKYPGLYAAGVAYAPATNVAHAFPEQMWVMGRPEGEDFPARYVRMSALYQQETIEAPLMLLHGTADAVVLYSDSVALIERLMERGKAFEFVPMPGSTHMWEYHSLAWHRYGYRKIADFLDRHLGGDVRE